MSNVGPLFVSVELTIKNPPSVSAAFRKTADSVNKDVRSCSVCRFGDRGSYVCNEHQKTVDLLKSLMKDLEGTECGS